MRHSLEPLEILARRRLVRPKLPRDAPCLLRKCVIWTVTFRQSRPRRRGPILLPRIATLV